MGVHFFNIMPCFVCKVGELFTAGVALGVRGVLPFIWMFLKNSENALSEDR